MNMSRGIKEYKLKQLLSTNIQRHKELFETSMETQLMLSLIKRKGITTWLLNSSKAQASSLQPYESILG